MTILYFIIILAVLIIVHELGHFLVAKASGMRVDEFGIGFPPRMFRIAKKGETEYTLNWLPIGGFVKIHGENYEDLDDPNIDVESDPTPQESQPDDRDRSFVNKPRHKQALVLVAGVTFNVIFAWLLISIGFMAGLPTPVDHDGPGEVTNPGLVITRVAEESPAAKAGLQVGDRITEVSTNKMELVVNDGEEVFKPEAVSSFIQEHNESNIAFRIERGDMSEDYSLTPAQLSADDEYRRAGIAMSMIGTLRLGPVNALTEGWWTTGDLIHRTAVGLGGFVKRAVIGTADYSNVAGPVGIVGLVGDASMLGWIYVLQFSAFISINLAIINLVPIPALDGGRLLFVLVESIKGSAINPKVASIANLIGFALLIVLMIAVTYNDIIRLIA